MPESLLGKTDYDLFILDLMMPGLGGVELIKYLNRNKNLTPVMVMSSVEDPAVIKQVFQLGIVGFLPKSYSVYEIVAAIESCREGNVHVPGLVSASLTMEQNLQITQEPKDVKVRLTKRQLEIMSLMERGLSNQEIADNLFISKATVKTHINKLFKLFDVNNRVSCLRAARDSGLRVEM